MVYDDEKDAEADEDDYDEEEGDLYFFQKEVFDMSRNCY